MSTNEDQLPIPEDKMSSALPSKYNPVTVTVKDTLGTIFLGILSVILLVGWMRAEGRNRVLITQLGRTVD